MWNNNEQENTRAAGAAQLTTSSSANTSARRAVIGPSIKIKGEVSGQEDLLVEGQVEGTISLNKNTVTVSNSGKVTANIYAVTIHVEGEIIGDLFGSDKVIVHKSGRVRGNVSAPRVSLEDGARIKGMIDTEPTGEKAAARSVKVEATTDQSATNGAAIAATQRPAGQATTTGTQATVRS